MSDIRFSYETQKSVSVKETVFPFISFSGADTELGSEMESTGEVMGRWENLEDAFMKAQVAAYKSEIKEGHIFFGVTDQDKQGMVPAAQEFQKAGQTNLATEGTYKVLQKEGFTNIERASRDREDPDNISDYIDWNEVASIINTTGPRKRSVDAKHIRRVSLMRDMSYFTTVEWNLNIESSIVATDFGKKLNFKLLLI